MRIAFRPVGITGIGVGTVGDQDDEFLTTALGRIICLVGIEIEFCLSQGGRQRRSPTRGFSLHTGIDDTVTGGDGLDQLVAPAGVVITGIIITAAVKSHIAESDCETALIYGVDDTVAIVIEDVKNGPFGNGQAAAT